MYFDVSTPLTSRRNDTDRKDVERAAPKPQLPQDETALIALPWMGLHYTIEETGS